MNPYEIEANAVLDLLTAVKKRTTYSVSAVPTMYSGGNAAVTVDTHASRAAVREWFRKAGAVVVHMWRKEDGDWRVIFRPACLPALRKFVYPVKAA